MELTSFRDDSLKLGLEVEVQLELLVLHTVEFLSQNSPLRVSSFQNFTASILPVAGSETGPTQQIKRV